MSFRVLLTLGLTVSVGALVLYLLILNGSVKPSATEEEIIVSTVFRPESNKAEAMSSSSVSPSPAPSPSVRKVPEEGSVSGVMLSQYATLMPGDDNQAVFRLRERLEELEYIESDEPSSVYNDSVQTAVRLFQRVSGTKITGIADAALQSLLYSEKAQPYRIVYGDSGNDVAQMQIRLKELGYYSGRTSGFFGPQTKDAIMLFEYQNGLPQDGILSNTDRKQLFSYHAGLNLSFIPEAPSSSSDNASETIDLIYSHNAVGLGLAVSDQIDKPYVWGKDGPEAFDCSGLLSYCLQLCGVSVSTTDPEGYSQIDAWQKIEKASFLKKGDLVFFKSDAVSGIVHAGISLGSSYFVHASSSSGKVVISSLSEPYWERNFVFGRRIFNG